MENETMSVEDFKNYSGYILARRNQVPHTDEQRLAKNKYNRIQKRRSNMRNFGRSEMRRNNKILDNGATADVVLAIGLTKGVSNGSNV